MPSIFQLALGDDFERLHPQLQRHFGFASSDLIACRGTGVMDEIWRRGSWTVPFLAIGANRHILFPERGQSVPFTIENYAYRDSFGRETLTFVRSFELAADRRRRFDATMIFYAQRGRIVDYLGTHQHLAVDLYPRVDERGGLRISSGAMRLVQRRADLRVPWFFAGRAELHERYDGVRARFGIDVRISHPWFGPMFGYRGSFLTTYLDTRIAPVPVTVKPLREASRC